MERLTELGGGVMAGLGGEVAAIGPRSCHTSCYAGLGGVGE